ncbi:MAG: DmsE family decaheme c-type cytochrome [Bacteroidetes bacterium]|nr:DmsE family decaheme c-type cytochrome [Bacteroidota bacterium]
MRTLVYHLLISAAVVLAAGGVERAFVSHAGTGLAPAITGTSTSGTPVAANVPSGKCTMVGGSATKDMTSENTAFKGAKTDPEECVKCHEDEVASYKSTTHAKSWQNGQSCESCHGESAKHVETGGAPGTIQTMKGKSANEVSQTCLNCHQRPGEQSHGQLSEHFRAGVGCTSCHDVHPSAQHKHEMNNAGMSAMLKGKQTDLCLSCHNTVNSDFNKPTHHRLKEGIVECSSCHNPHGTTQEHQLRADKKTLCLNCHQDKRGPFVYEHNATALEGCVACHEGHGSSARNLLKDRDPRTLCISCHSKEIGAGVPHSRANFSLQTTGDCTRCHNTIHGSNRDEYFIQ